MRNQSKRYLFLFCSLAALLMGLSGTSVVFAQGHTRLASSQKGTSQICGAWSVVSSPNANTNENYLYGVAAVSANDVWAVGYYVSNSTITYSTLIEQWNGTSWSLVPTPNAASSYNVLSGVAAISANDVWAVGDYENSTTKADRTLTLHWDGTKWSPVTSPNIGSSSENGLSGVAAVSTSDVWAVGEYYNGSTSTHQTLIEFYC